jgi:UDP-glucose 4-epimerase
MKILDNKTILITGGTGSLGKVLTKRLLSGKEGTPKKIIILSRDEAKQHYMRLEYENKHAATEEVIYNNFKRLLEFRIGDVRDYHTICSALTNTDIVINAAALKQVPSCEYFPFEAVRTNINGPENIIRAIRENQYPVKTVLGVSTDKACKPVCVMGMTKALQERIFISGNISVPNTRFICVRYGNVLASRGSVIPLFHEQIKNGGPVTVTTKEMTRFLLPLEKAVDTIIAALKSAKRGETYVPRVKSINMTDLAKALIEDRQIKIKYTGIRPGEKYHEIMVSIEEAWRTYDRGNYYAIQPMLPELIEDENIVRPLKDEYSSEHSIMTTKELDKVLTDYNLKVGQNLAEEGEFLR